MWEKLTAKPLKPSTLTMDGISRKTMEEHFKLYQGYVNKTNEIMEKLGGVDLKTANQVFSDLRALKVELSFAIGGVKHHEIYFDHLGGEGGKPSGKLLQMIERDFGSFDNWAADLKATGIAARGWVWLAYDRDWKRFFNRRTMTEKERYQDRQWTRECMLRSRIGQEGYYFTPYFQQVMEWRRYK